MMGYEKACRLCLKELNGPGIDCSSIVEMRDTISALFGIKISQNDTTKCICNKCFESTMNFKAFKKTVLECQLIIKEYDTIKTKILQRQTAIKQEIIDLSETETKGSPTTTSKEKKKRPVPNQVTDTEINDILDIVHENNDSNKSPKRRTHKATTTPSQIKTEKTFPDPIPSPDSGNASTKTCTEHLNSATLSNEIEPPNKGNERENRLSSNCAISTSGIRETSQEDTIKTESETIIVDEPATVDTVTSSVLSPAKDHGEPGRQEKLPSTSRALQTPQNISSSESLEENLNDNASKKTSDKSNHTELEDEALPRVCSNPRVILRRNILSKGYRIIETPQPSMSSPTISQNISHSSVSSTDFICPECSSKFESVKDLDSHVKGHTDRAETSPSIKRGSRKRHSEPDSTTIRRSARIAQSQTLQNLFTRENRRRISARKNSISAKLPQAITQLALSQQRMTRTHAASPETSSNLSSASSPYLDFGHDQSNSKTRNSKRIITITLLRSKDSVNFRYCDQYKNIIDFESVTSEELCDIRSSLMSPNIWNNLTDVFKTSTPDDETIEQLKTIFGQGFRWS